MNNTDFWARIRNIISEGFTPEGLTELDRYAVQFINGQLLYQRFSHAEQFGCAAGSHSHVIATILTGAEVGTSEISEGRNDFKRQLQHAEAQTQIIEQWAQKTNCWFDGIDESMVSVLGEQIAEGGEAHVYDQGRNVIKTIGLDYFVEPILALDRITLHNTYFPETRMKVLGFGKGEYDEFRILVEQPYVQGSRITVQQISEYMKSMSFKLINPKNWTYATPYIYLSDMHDENVILTDSGIAVIDCDIRINTPELRCGGCRELKTEIISTIQS